MADMDTYDGDQRGYEGNYRVDTSGENYGHNDRDYGRERSRSPGPDRDGDARIRDEPMNGRAERDPPPDKNGSAENATNSGSNLFVTGIHPRLSEEQIRELFGEYGVVEKCNIMRDPHTRESRGFGFVNMATPEDADLAKDKLQGHQYEGRTLSIEKARRARPRTPTPGKYFGPPKRDDRPPRGGGYRDRYDDRGYGGRRDDRRGGGGGYRDRYDDRGYGGGGGRRDDYGRSDRDRYAQRSDDRYGDRRGGGGGGGGYGGGSGSGGGSYDRPPRGPPPEQASGGGYSGHPRDAAPREDYGRRRDYD